MPANRRAAGWAVGSRRYDGLIVWNAGDANIQKATEHQSDREQRAFKE